MSSRSLCRLGVALVGLALGCRGEARGNPPPSPDRPAAAITAPMAAGGSSAIGQADRAGTLTAVGIVSRIGAAGAADAAAKRAKLGEAVTLYAVVEVTHAGQVEVFSDAPSLVWRRRTITPRPLAEAPRLALAWHKIEPTEATMSNEASGSFRYERIAYAATPMAAAGGAIAADVAPTLTPDHGGGAVGTMRYQLVARQGDRVLATPGLEARRTRAAGGLTEDVHRVTIRRGDDFLGYLTEMYGQPYIWASAGPSARTHQSERLEGSDCADLMVYGARRAGLDIPYGWTGSLKQHARALGKGALAADGVYRDRDGQPVAFTRPGDLILFPRHVGALYEDRGQRGVVDVDDVMIHTLFDSPKEQPIRDSGYADNPIEILRWKGVR